MDAQQYILAATQMDDAADTIADALGERYTFERARTFTESLEKCKNRRFEFIFIDIELVNFVKQADLREHLYTFWRLYPTVEIVILCRPHKVRSAVQAVKSGASDYLTYPVSTNEVRLVIDQITENIRMQSELDYLRDKFWNNESLTLLRTNSVSMRHVFNKIRAVSQSDSTVLLTGETGTGKSIIANLIHQHSIRRDKQFISIHCGAIPDTLLESELFGHEKGAFTGAVRRKLGKFEIADKGTIFLDEIGTISPAMQIKLLQILQDRTFQRVGGEVTLKADVRIIAATNADIKSMVDAGEFRNDLYYRLNVFPIEIPPLRERAGDIPLLVEQFIKKLNRFYGRMTHGIDTEVVEALQKYSWPGNIRELENIIERAYIIETTNVLTRKSFPSELFQPEARATTACVDTSLTLEQIRTREVERIERTYLKELLKNQKGRIGPTAQAAGIGSRQLHKLLKKYGLRKEDYKNSKAE
ncbi:sigma-54-dependent Fis family transcriptional regulator [candidate division KSB1 bacterium]|nr:sigma-54-dependent Fis family transcriptional regulator [candidate division KSB1 bacterium]RQW00292.1 MAG: sigma-54-dependent Fis family transcriptional regulator [candidate division KSB1 bacterium]